MTMKKKPFENNVGKGENAGNQHFLLFPHCFLPIPKRMSVFNLHSLLSSALNLDWSGFDYCSIKRELIRGVVVRDRNLLEEDCGLIKQWIA